MLKEIFRSEPIPYLKIGEPGSGPSAFGINYHGNIPPYCESVFWWAGLVVGLYPLPAGPESIYLWGVMKSNKWPSWDSAFWRFDGRSGKFIKRILGFNNLGTILQDSFHLSRGGKLWSKSYYQDVLMQATLGGTATALLGEEPEKTDPWRWAGSAFGDDVGGNLSINDFDPPPENTGFSFYGFGVGGDWALDELTNQGKGVLLDGSFADLRIWELTSGKWMYGMTMPNIIVAICFEDNDRAYILLNSRVIVLFDYVRGEVMGASRIPPPQGAHYEYWNTGNDVKMAWDPAFRRLLIIEVVPDNANGSCACTIRGFRKVPEPVRLTPPFPLKVARQGRTIPVLVQAKGDMNEGVGGYVVQSKISGAGRQVGIPISDHYGNTLIQVACGESGTSSEGESMGSPEESTSGSNRVTVEATIVVYAPDPADIPVSGVKGVAPGTDPSGGGGTAGGTQPGQPGGGTDEGTSLPETAPNMMYIMERVKASGTWQTAEIYDPKGRGEFLEACVVAMHDVDARWGFNRKTTGNQWNNHSVDFISWANPDGVTAEGFDCISGGAGNISWGFAGRSAGTLEHHYYPA
jgi:hypothetical protein